MTGDDVGVIVFLSVAALLMAWGIWYDLRERRDQ